MSIEGFRAGRTPTGGEVRVRAEEVPGARRAPFPALVEPMLAALAEAPFSSPDWLFEPKLDGFRTIAFVAGGKARLQSRRGLDVSARFADIARELARQPVAQAVFDGEVVALDARGRPCFQCLQRQLKPPSPGSAAASGPPSPILYYVFDILHLDGFDLTDVPLISRKALLDRAVSPLEHVRLTNYFEEKGEAVYERAVGVGYEGVMAKRLASRYEPGRRSTSWLKIKATLSDEFVVGGFSRGLGARGDTFGALLVGQYDEAGRLVYRGHVGTGFDWDTLRELRSRLEKIKARTCPFSRMPPLNAPTQWVAPEMVVQVRFSQWTQDGLMRLPVFMRVRDDKLASEVRREQVVPGPGAGVAGAGVAREGGGENGGLLAALQHGGDKLAVEAEGHRLVLSNLDRQLWPAAEGRPGVTKRDLLVYLLQVSDWLLPHLRDRPLTLKRYPDGIAGEHFYQKHWEGTLPAFVETVPLTSEHDRGIVSYLMCNNLATLLWLGQVADIELNTWFSRVRPGPDFAGAKERGALPELLSNYPDFIVFDLDPYIYSGTEKKGEEPELNPEGFSRACAVALWLKDLLESLSLTGFVKTSGATGLHVLAPVLRQFDYSAVRSAAETIGRFLLRAHPDDVTMEWTVEKRTGKVFVDHNRNARGQTLASVYSPRPAKEATVSMALRWEELSSVYPTDFTVRTAPERLRQRGDPWKGILEAKADLRGLLKKGG